MRRARHEQGLTQVQLAEALDMSQGNVQKYEAGKQAFTLEFLNSLATILGQHPTYFMTAGDGLSEEERELIAWLRGNPELKPIALATFRSLKQHQAEAA